LSEDDQPIIINGWSIFAHALFLAQLAELLLQVTELRQKFPEEYRNKKATKRLAAIFRLAFDVIPQDPTRNEYRQGCTLGDDYKHWFRAKFFQQYRLFFRYHQAKKIIVLVWVNDDNSKRVYGSRTDAYAVFRNMLENGYPPNDWDSLIKDAQVERDYLEQVINTEI
jgi:toxin YhaV